LIRGKTAKRNGSEKRYRPANVARIAKAIEPNIKVLRNRFLIFLDLELTNQDKKK
jgi:hypothetical protein